MTQMSDAATNRLLMSDSLRGVVPDLEDAVSSYEDAYIIASIVMKTPASTEVTSGTLVGIAFERACVKIDMRMPVMSAFKAYKEITSNEVTCNDFFLSLSAEDLQHNGDYRVTSPRLMDFDNQRKTCTLGVDLTIL